MSGRVVTPTPRRRRGVAVALAIVLVAVALVVLRRSVLPTDRCLARGLQGSASLDLAQAANAATIAAVARRQGLPDHAVTVALAAALQESKLRNLTYGDLDSVGLFQQRPSQGWGTPAQLLTPSYAAAAFYRGLQKVPGWQALAISDAAQQVQRSAAPDAYVKWEPMARAQAEAFTGEAPAGLSCSFGSPSAVTAAGTLGAAMTEDLGTQSLGPGLASGRGWLVASWLVAHAQAYRITWVSYAGQRWTPEPGRWVPDHLAGDQVQLGRAGLAPGADPLSS